MRKDERLVVDAADQMRGPGFEKILRNALARKIPDGGLFRGNRPASITAPGKVRIPGFQPDQGVFTEFGLDPGERLRRFFRTGRKSFPGILVQAGLFSDVDATECAENEADDPSPWYIRVLKHFLPAAGPVSRRDGPESQAEQGEELHAVSSGKRGTKRAGNRRCVLAFHPVSEFDNRKALFSEIGEDLIEKTLCVEDEPLGVGLGRFEGDPVFYRRFPAEGLGNRRRALSGTKAVELLDLLPEAVRQSLSRPSFFGQAQQVSKR